MIKVNNFYQVNGRLSNSYVYVNKKDIIIFDAAFKDDKYILGFIESNITKDFARIKLIIATHNHADHIGGLPALRRRTQAKTAIPQASRHTLSEKVKNPSDIFTRLKTGFQEITHPRFWNMYTNRNRIKKKKELPRHNGESLTKIKDVFIKKADIYLNDGDALPGFKEWQVLACPGHSYDSTCFYHKTKKILITGDTILSSASNNALHLPSIYSNYNELKASVEKLQKLKVKYICPGHGPILKGEELQKLQLVLENN